MAHYKPAGVTPVCPGMISKFRFLNVRYASEFLIKPALFGDNHFEQERFLRTEPNHRHLKNFELTLPIFKNQLQTYFFTKHC